MYQRRNVMTDNFDVKLSVIVPTYNLEKFIVETLDSITNQKTDYSFEIIVIDDGSSDKTVEIVKNYSQTHSCVQLIKNDRTKGVSGARNTGILAAKGEWIAFLDGDDIWLENNIQQKLSAAENSSDYEIISSGYFDWFYEESLQSSSRTHVELTPFLQKFDGEEVIIDNLVPTFLKYPKLIHTGTIFFKQKLLQHTSLFNEHYKMGEDRDLWLRLAVNTNDMVYINEDYLLYRKRDESLTRRGIPGSIWAARSLINLLRQPEFKPYKKELTVKIAEYQLKNSYYYRKEKQFLNGLKSALTALRYDIKNIRILKSAISCVFWQ